MVPPPVALEALVAGKDVAHQYAVIVTLAPLVRVQRRRQALCRLLAPPIRGGTSPPLGDLLRPNVLLLSQVLHEQVGRNGHGGVLLVQRSVAGAVPALGGMGGTHYGSVCPDDRGSFLRLQ